MRRKTKHCTVSIPVELANRLEHLKPFINLSQYCSNSIEQLVSDFENASSREAKLVVALKTWGWDITITN